MLLHVYRLGLLGSDGMQLTPRPPFESESEFESPRVKPLSHWKLISKLISKFM